MQFLDLAGVKKFKQYVDENFTPVEDHENAEKVAAAALNNLNDRLTNIEDEDWVTAEDYSEIESAHLDVYSKEEIDNMLSNIEGGTGEENVIEAITFNGSVIPVNNSTKTAAIMAKIPHAETDSSSTATAFIATVPGITTLEDGVCCYIKNTVIASASGCTLNVNNLGAKRIYVTTAKATAATTQFALNYTYLFIYNSTRVSGGCWDICQLFNSNTTYSVISTTELQTGTATSSRVITAARLAENYNITNGTINIAGNSITPITSETDPTVPAWAKTETKPTYTASEVGALPDTTSIPTESTVSGWGFTKNAAPGTLITNATTAQTESSGEALSGTITLHKIAKTGTYSDLIGTPTIPTKVSDLTNDSNFTSNTGTVTGVKINGTTKTPTSGTVDLGTVLTSETSLSKGTTTGSGNAVTDISVSGHQITITKDSTFLTSETSLSKGTTTGSGNAVTDISVSGHQITLTKDTTFLTSHQDISGKADLSGAAFTGAVTGTSSGNTAQFRNITISSSEPTSSDGSNGDIWIVI